MGLLKTQELDNGNIGFECIYGGKEAPFGGIDSSKAPRYIDPTCFADASNFLLIDNELCLCTLALSSMAANPGVTYPMLPTSTLPGVLLGVGNLPTDGINKNWALYVSPAADSANLWHYRLILWTNDIGTVEVREFAILGQQIIAPAQNAKATVTVSWTFPFTAVQTMPFGHPPDPYDHLWYEMYALDLTIGGVPTGGLGVCQYKPVAPYKMISGVGMFGNTPGAGPGTPPTLTQITDQLFDFFTYHPATPDLVPYTTGARLGANSFELVAMTQPPGPGGCGSFPSVDGAAGNAITLSGSTYSFQYGYYKNPAGTPFVESYTGGPGAPPPSPFAQPSVQVTITPFSGGINAGQLIYSNTAIQELTWETVGDSIYFAGWPAGYMLQYNDKSKQFTYLTQYQGARVLRKMSGHLISVGAIASAQQPVINNSQLWFSWSAPAPYYNIWSALNPVTNLQSGAGGGQLADISDQLTGLVVSNSVAFILRAAGLSYAQTTQSAKLPFIINHIDLCKDGQGCESIALWTQFDQLGFFVGNTNVFVLAQGPQAIGDKILETLFPSLITAANRLSDSPPAPPYTLVGNPAPMQDKYYNKVSTEPLTFPQSNRIVTQFSINVGGVIFMFDPQYQTWMKLDANPVFPPETSSPDFKWSILKTISLFRNGGTGNCGSYQSKESYVYGQNTLTGVYQAPKFYQLSPFLPFSQSAHIVFPAEEISLGRDITVDALYVLACGIPGAVVDFAIDGWEADTGTVIGAFNGQLVFGPSASPETYEEYQVFDVSGQAITVKAPQVRASVSPQSHAYSAVVPYPIVSDAYIKLVKVVMYGSYDPNQRPV